MICGFQFEKEITKRYGYIRRARNSYFYTESGIRLTDMFQESGKAVLGWGFGSAKKVFKNFLDRGALGSFETRQSVRLEKILKQIFGHWRTFRIYAKKETAYSYNPVVWLPWMDEQQIEPLSQEKNPPCILITPLYPWAQSVFIVGFTVQDDAIQPSDCIPEPLLAAITRSFYDFFAEVPNRTEKQWKHCDFIVLRYWKRRGAYLFPQIAKENYTAFFYFCLDNRVLISPDYNQPSLVPFFAHKGDFALLAKNTFQSTGTL